MKRLLWLGFLAGCAPGAKDVTLSSPQPDSAGQFLSGTSSGRAYKLYVPSTYASTPFPLVVMLHGCAQDPDDFAAGTRMNAIAEANGFFALYPQEKPSDNAGECWNWFEPSHQARGAGEPASIVGVIDHVAQSYQIDAARTYALGMSSGGAMAVILGATYPDRFAAIATGEGLEYEAATSLASATSAESNGGPEPVGQGQVAYDAMGSYAHPVRAFVVQGASDGTVAPVNGTQVVAQWLATNGLAGSHVSTTPTSTAGGQVSGGHAYTVTTYDDSSTHETIVESIVVTGMNHAWSGGSSDGSYTDPQGPNASQLAWDFFAAGTAVPDGGVLVDAGAPNDLAHGAAAPDLALKINSGPSTQNFGSGCAIGSATLGSVDPKRNSAPTAWAAGALLMLAFSLRRRRA